MEVRRQPKESLKGAPNHPIPWARIFHLRGRAPFDMSSRFPRLFTCAAQSESEPFHVLDDTASNRKPRLTPCQGGLWSRAKNVMPNKSQTQS
jgi:hypothetical protein